MKKKYNKEEFDEKMKYWNRRMFILSEGLAIPRTVVDNECGVLSIRRIDERTGLDYDEAVAKIIDKMERKEQFRMKFEMFWNRIFILKERPND